jgi:hypothetical protein
VSTICSPIRLPAFRGTVAHPDLTKRVTEYVYCMC